MKDFLTSDMNLILFGSDEVSISLLLTQLLIGTLETHKVRLLSETKCYSVTNAIMLVKT